MTCALVARLDRWLLWLGGLIFFLRGGFQTAVVWADLREEIQTLYSSRFLLSPQGVPWIPVGIMEGQKTVRFSCPHGCLAYLSSQGQPTRTLRLSPRSVGEIRSLRSQAATLRYGLIAFHQPLSRMEQAEEQKKEWEKKGYKVDLWKTGSLFGIKGRVFDNRRVLGILGEFSELSKAKEKAQALAQKEGFAIRIHEEIAILPRMSYALRQEEQVWKGDELVRLVPPNGRMIRLEDVEYGKGYAWYRIQPQLHQGEILFAPDRKGEIAVVNRLPLSIFLEGLLKAEMPPKAPLEALKAQAVCARNEILAKIGTRHRADPYLFCSQTHCQVYAGAPPPTPTILKAIRQTAGEVLLLSDGQLADAPFSAICGGHTEDNDVVWSQAPHPALRGKADLSENFSSLEPSSRGLTESVLLRWLSSSPPAFCRDALPAGRQKFRWQRSFPAEILDAMVNQHHPLGAIQQIKVEKRGQSGRVIALRLIGTRQAATVHGELVIRRLLGGLYSSMFLIQARLSDTGRPLQWTFLGGGWGHGVGLCQYGAIGRARVGFTYKEILQHYFSKTQLSRLY